MPALPTHCKLPTEIVSVSDIVTGEGTFDCVKLGHLDSLDLQYTPKECKEKLYFQPVFEPTVLQELPCSVFFPFMFGVCDNRLVLELIYSSSDYYIASTITKLLISSKITCLDWIQISY